MFLAHVQVLGAGAGVGQCLCEVVHEGVQPFLRTTCPLFSVPGRLQ